MSKDITDIFENQNERIREERLLLIFDDMTKVFKKHNVEPCSEEHYDLIFITLRTNIAIAYDHDPKIAWQHFKNCVSDTKKLWEQSLELVEEDAYIDE